MSLKFPKIQVVKNTEKRLLAMLELSPCRVGTMVRHAYKNSKQPEKKAATFERALRSLERRGRVRQCDGVWFIEDLEAQWAG